MFTSDAVIILRYAPDTVKGNDLYAFNFYCYDIERGILFSAKQYIKNYNLNQDVQVDAI